VGFGDYFDSVSHFYTKVFDPLGFGQGLLGKFKGPSKPKFPKPPALDPEADAKKALSAAEHAKALQLQQYGLYDLILSGMGGLGTIPGKNKYTGGLGG